ncbi:aspartyl-tRNA synthetase [Thermocrinis albus DSM 14484]|uniref:Aspartate--tRNA(Asp/Asn) ligase n=1 Tax=Thermocrinis albus (strain DSM 14484 / JCM 11386 / HI 11/12) TaxID=638303 RepID=D3SMB5_THEAH|nr:aspartate--tRNA ligase [Thermocrinis albus]ADC89895.1 aspartyl-tRNA synthetase [Thermocrinis albus DSM 14484]
MKRTKYCGEIGEEDLGREVVLCGWVHRVRNHGGVIFIDLRDREGLVQVVVEESVNPEAYNVADQLRSEYVVCVKGVVRKRPPGTENPKLKTGMYEVVGYEIEVLNTCEPLPFPVEEETPVSEELRLKYRFLDLRRESMKENILFRHRSYQIIRRTLVEKGFVEVETPFLTKSTPEGARDFLVPSRLHPGKFYALPQSPQLFKQVLMVAGIDKYFQIVKCLRDEDLRADRQPEFTQVDIEMSFVDEEDVIQISEELVSNLFKELLGIDLKRPFDRISYAEVMERYGTDKPDRRFGLELVDVSQELKETHFMVFRSVLETGGVVKGMNLKGLSLSRRELDDLTKKAQELGARGLAWIKLEKGKLVSPITKFLTEGETNALLEKMGAEEGDTIVLCADSRDVVNKVLSSLRLQIAKQYGLIDEEKWDILWVVDFPLLEWDQEEGRFVSVHHPFTAPRQEDIPKLEEALRAEDPKDKIKLVSSVKARAYDLVINGEEVGGGSVRIHDPKLQKMIFDLLNISQQEAEEKFGFLLRALRYGAPPHAGIAFGLDRLLAIMRGLDSIRDVIAFPKTQKGVCPLTGAPDYVSPKQLRELHIRPVTE